MPTKPRIQAGNVVYHVMNRAIRNLSPFQTDRDYLEFEKILRRALEKYKVRVISYCIMPNHWHLLLWPCATGVLSRFVQWISSVHAKLWNRTHSAVGRGAIYQSRYKSIPVKSDGHLLVAMRYVEQNPLRAGLVKKPRHWRWSSAHERTLKLRNVTPIITTEQTPVPPDFVSELDERTSRVELGVIRTHIRKSIPFGLSMMFGRRKSESFILDS